MPFRQYEYNPEKALAVYQETLQDSRAGVTLTSAETKAMADIIDPLLRHRLSPYQIFQAHPELNVCEKTIYNYIESDVFYEVASITVMDLRRKVSRKPRKDKAGSYKKRQDRRYPLGLTYRDYCAYLAESPDAFVTQIEAVYNNGSGNPFIQTFKFVKAGLLFALLHQEKTASAMLSSICRLEKILTPALFRRYVHVLLTDRGAEFTTTQAMETAADGSPECSSVALCSPSRKGRWGTSMSSCATSSRSRQICGPRAGWPGRP